MVSIGYITLSNAYDGTLVSVIVQVEQLNRRAATGCSTKNTQAGLVPDEVLRPPFTTWIEEWDKRLRFWIVSFKAVPTTFVAIATGQSQIVGVI
jgi:hypothetical protein